MNNDCFINIFSRIKYYLNCCTQTYFENFRYEGSEITLYTNDFLTILDDIDTVDDISHVTNTDTINIASDSNEETDPNKNNLSLITTRSEPSLKIIVDSPISSVEFNSLPNSPICKMDVDNEYDNVLSDESLE